MSPGDLVKVAGFGGSVFCGGHVIVVHLCDAAFRRSGGSVGDVVRPTSGVQRENQRGLRLWRKGNRKDLIS